MEAMEKAIEENHKAMELRSSSIEGMIQKLAAAWEKKSPTTNVHTQLIELDQKQRKILYYYDGASNTQDRI